MYLRSKNLKSFSFILIWLAIIITSVSIIIQLITTSLNIEQINSNIDNTNNLWVPAQPWANIWNSLSSFTMQSNILVLIFFILVLNNSLNSKKVKWINDYFGLTITTYITITMIIFWAVLFKIMLLSTNFHSTLGIIDFTNTFLLHLVTNYFLFINSRKYKTNS